MKKLSKQLLTKLSQQTLFWKFHDQAVQPALRYMTRLRDFKTDPQELLVALVKEKFPDLKVAHGPFKGMKYPSLEAIGCSTFPRLLGSYEKELDAVMEKAIGKKYHSLIDVGCAGGHYAVGFPYRDPDIRVHAYDIVPAARASCAELARLNGVEDRVTIGEACTPETLISFPFEGPSLVLSDCEGYEMELFTPPAVAALADHDVLIEVHDFTDPSISRTLRQRFEKTHTLEVIEAVHDLKKVQTYDYAELEGLDWKTKQYLLSDPRPIPMDWFFFKSRKSPKTT